MSEFELKVSGSIIVLLRNDCREQLTELKGEDRAGGGAVAAIPLVSSCYNLHTFGGLKG